jgi:hypothetical protein
MSWQRSVVRATQALIEAQDAAASARDERVFAWQVAAGQGLTVAQITRATRTALAEAGIPIRRQLGVSRRSVERAVQTNY